MHMGSEEEPGWTDLKGRQEKKNQDLFSSGVNLTNVSIEEEEVGASKEQMRPELHGGK